MIYEEPCTFGCGDRGVRVDEMTAESDEVRHLVVAPKLAAQGRVPPDWQQQIARIPGIQLIGSSPNRVQLRATAGGLHELKSKLGDLLNIENAMPRSTED